MNQAQEIAKRMGCQLQRRDPFGEIIMRARVWEVIGENYDL